MSSVVYKFLSVCEWMTEWVIATAVSMQSVDICFFDAWRHSLYHFWHKSDEWVWLVFQWRSVSGLQAVYVIFFCTPNDCDQIKLRGWLNWRHSLHLIMMLILSVAHRSDSSTATNKTKPLCRSGGTSVVHHPLVSFTGVDNTNPKNKHNASGLTK